jgi:hypothetical protein
MEAAGCEPQEAAFAVRVNGEGSWELFDGVATTIDEVETEGEVGAAGETGIVDEAGTSVGLPQPAITATQHTTSQANRGNFMNRL